MDRVERIRERLEQALAPAALEIEDQSHLHAGHAGAARGGHYAVRVVSAAFAGRSLVQRHRMVYAALGDLMHGEVHALQIEAVAP